LGRRLKKDKCTKGTRERQAWEMKIQKSSSPKNCNFLDDKQLETTDRIFSDMLLLSHHCTNVLLKLQITTKKVDSTEFCKVITLASHSPVLTITYRMEAKPLKTPITCVQN
jgi:hypothetical protein